MSFGYIGDTSTSVKQQVKNKGILTTQESFDLERQGFLGGSLEFIQSQSFSSTVTAIDFTSIKEDVYDVHFLTCSNFKTASDAFALGEIFKLILIASLPFFKPSKVSTLAFLSFNISLNLSLIHI